jgi:hypothetical protein
MRRILLQLTQLNNVLLPFLSDYRNRRMNQEKPAEVWYTNELAAEYLCISLRSLSRHTKAGLVARSQKGRGGRYEKQELLRFRKAYYNW